LILATSLRPLLFFFFTLFALDLSCQGKGKEEGVWKEKSPKRGKRKIAGSREGRRASRVGRSDSQSKMSKRRGETRRQELWENGRGKREEEGKQNEKGWRLILVMELSRCFL
jgi:hypothetical protein